MIIDTHAHVVPGSLIETLRAEHRMFPSVRIIADGGATRMAFAGEAPIFGFWQGFRRCPAVTP